MIPGVSSARGGSPATHDGSRFQLWRWVILCAVAETLGMTAAAAATRLADAWLPEPRQGADSLLVLLMIVAGGLVEGVALGTLQSIGLARWIPAVSRPRWILATTVVAGLGWAAASAPAQFSDSTDSFTPPVAVVVGGGLLLGALMGCVLGAVQAGGLRGRVRHPWRWIGISLVAWAPAMGIIFTGATTAGAEWPAFLTLLWAAATGAAAGATLGLLSGLLWPVLHAP